jgi:alpha-tubulin suppressor-like RCC1 family protein
MLNNSFFMAIGNNSHGQLGIGRISIESAPALVTNKKILTRSASNATLLSISSSIPTRSAHVLHPTLTQIGRQHRISSIVSGLDFSLFLTKSCVVFACGRGDFGQLGTSISKTPLLQAGKKKAFLRSKLVPIVFGRKEQVMVVAAGSRSAMACTVEGKLYAWGDNYSGQLALQDGKEEEDIVYCPTQVPFKNDNVHCCSVAMGCGHALICVQAGK